MKRPDQMTRDELEAEVAYLRGEVSGSAESTGRDHLRAALGLTESEAAILDALHKAKGAVVVNWRLAEAAPPGRMTYDRNDIAAVKVWVSRIRKKLGAETIATVFGSGYRLSPVGMATVNAALCVQAEVAA
jgi:DNA-binding response OmpR family regulator